jgi:hypothetical protein
MWQPPADFRSFVLSLKMYQVFHCTCAFNLLSTLALAIARTK